MKSKNYYQTPETPWYKSLWFLALINGMGALNTFIGMTTLGPILFANQYNVIIQGGFVGFVNAWILAYTLWHEEEVFPYQSAYWLVGIWTLALLTIQVTVCIISLFAIMWSWIVIYNAGWRKLTGFMGGSIGAVIIMHIVNIGMGNRGVDVDNVLFGILLYILGGTIYGLIFADTIKRDNRRQRRIKAEQIQVQKEKPHIPQRFSREYPSDFNNNLTVGDDGELVEIDEKDIQSDKKRNS